MGMVDGCSVVVKCRCHCFDYPRNVFFFFLLTTLDLSHGVWKIGVTRSFSMFI